MREFREENYEMEEEETKEKEGTGRLCRPRAKGKQLLIRSRSSPCRDRSLEDENIARKSSGQGAAGFEPSIRRHNTPRGSLAIIAD